MLLSAVYRAAYMCVMFVAQLILANLLQPAGLGTLSLMILNASFVTLLTGIGTDTMAIHALTQKKWSITYGASFLFKTALIQIGLYGLMQWWSMAVTNVSLLSREENSWIVDSLYFLGLIGTEKMLVLYYASHKARLYNVLLLAAGMAYLFVLAVAYFAKATLINPMLLVSAQSLLQCLLLFLLFIREQNIERLTKIVWKDTLRILRVSGVVMVTNVVQLLAYRIDYWLLRRSFSDYELGIYAQANKFAGLLWVLPNILAMLLVPRFSRLKQAELPVVFRMAALLNMAAALATAVITYLLYRHVLLPQYSAGLQAFWMMFPGYFCWAMVIYFGAYFSWKGIFAVNLFASSFCLLLVFIVDIGLIPRYAVKGAAVANTIAYTCTLLLYILIFCWKDNFTAGRLFQFKRSDVRLLKKLAR